MEGKSVKPITVRLLLDDDGDAETLAAELRKAAQADKPSVTLWGFHCRVEVVEPTSGSRVAHRPRRRREDYPFLEG